jgi:hypothetical protein
VIFKFHLHTGFISGHVHLKREDLDSVPLGKLHDDFSVTLEVKMIDEIAGALESSWDTFALGTNEAATLCYFQQAALDEDMHAFAVATRSFADESVGNGAVSSTVGGGDVALSESAFVPTPMFNTYAQGKAS